jgi:hypothetical protein
MMSGSGARPAHPEGPGIAWRRRGAVALGGTALALVLVASLAGCGGAGSGGQDTASMSPSPRAAASGFPSTFPSQPAGSGVSSSPGGGSAGAGGVPGATGPAGGASVGPRVDARSWSGQPASNARRLTAPVRLLSLRSAPNVDGGTRYERVVLEFAGGLPGYHAQYVPEVVRPGSGAPLPLAGKAALELVLTSATAHDDQGVSTLGTPSDGRDPSGALSYALAGDFEGMVHIGIGLARATSFRVLELHGPDRLAIDFLT